MYASAEMVESVIAAIEEAFQWDWGGNGPERMLRLYITLNRPKRQDNRHGLRSSQLEVNQDVYGSP